MKDIEKLVNSKIENIPQIPEIASFQPINPFYKSKTTEDALEEECSYDEDSFDIDNNNCEICRNTIKNGGYVLQNSTNEKDFYFCSSKCINDFKNKGYEINDYELYEISRCASYQCCLELGNLRRRCEKTKSLTNINIIESLKHVNFCEPSTAGQIQASYAIYKHLQKVDAENEKLSAENTKLNKRTQFLTSISTTMAVLTIFLTIVSVVKSFIDKPIVYKEELEIIETILKEEQKQIDSIENEHKEFNDTIRELNNNLSSTKATLDIINEKLSEDGE